MKNIRTRTLLNLSACLLAVVCVTSALAQSPAGPRKDRVFVKDFEGIWIIDSYLKELSRTRSPHAAAKKVPPVVIAIKREGRGYPIVVTDFNKASLQVVIEVEPESKPGSYRLVIATGDGPVSSSEVKYLPLQGEKAASGRFETLRIAEPAFMKGRWADYVRLPGELSASVNRIVIAGRYKDEKGRDWAFSEAGEAAWPDQSFVYELSLNDPGAGCEYLQTEDLRDGQDVKRFGYAWKAGKLLILPAKLSGKKVTCGGTPLATLTPQ
jgi:hypothetical protein